MARQAVLAQPVMQLRRQRTGDERRRVDAGQRLLRPMHDRKIPRRRARRHPPLQLTRCDLAPPCALRAESARHVARGQRRDVAERPQSQIPPRPAQFDGEIQRGFRGDLRQRHPAQELGPAADGQLHPAARGQHRGDDVVGDPGEAVRPGQGGGVEKHLHRLRLSPVVLRGAVGAEDHQARPQRLHARGDVADAGEHRLELPGVARGIGLHHDQIGTRRLRMAAPLAPAHARPACGIGAGGDGRVVDDGDRRRRPGIARRPGRPRRLDRPIRQPHPQYPHQRTPPITRPAAAGTGTRSRRPPHPRPHPAHRVPRRRHPMRWPRPPMPGSRRRSIARRVRGGRPRAR